MRIVIVGNGVAGITAARTIRKLQPEWPVTVVSAETDHFFSRTALMYVYMGHLTYDDTKPYEDWFWGENRIDLVRGYVKRIDQSARSIEIAGRAPMPFDALLLATGSVYNTFGWPGQDLPGVQGLVSYQDLELLEKNTRDIDRAVVVGGGLIGIELTEMLRSRHIEVTFLVREEAYMDYLFPGEESAMIERQIRAHGVDLRLRSELAEIVAGSDGRVSSVRTSSGEAIDCQLVGLTAGVRPNTALAAASGIETSRGILVDRFFRTSATDVFAVGDCAEFRDPPLGRGPVEQLWYTGREHGETVGYTIAGHERSYNPGVFFNSAKFFDLEYQTYGDVPAQTPADHVSSVWTGRGERLMRINARRSDSGVAGINALGVRLRQNVCADWIASGAPFEEVKSNFRKAVFDPEFSGAITPENWSK